MNQEIKPLEILAGKRSTIRPPFINGFKPLSHSWNILKRPNEYFLEGHRKYGPCFRVNLAGLNYVVLAGPAVNRWMPKGEPEFISARGIWDSVHKVTGVSPEANMINLDGKPHTKLRSITKRGMSRTFMEERVELASDACERFFTELPAHADLEINKFCKQLVYNQLGETMAGSAPKPLFYDFKRLVDGAIERALFPLLLHLPLPKSLVVSRARVQDFTERIAASGVYYDAIGNNFLSDIVEGLRHGVYKKQDIPNLIAAPFFAGIDTLAHALSFSFYSIVSNPILREEVEAEVRNTFIHKSKLSIESLRGMKVLSNTFLESMRRYPVVHAQRRKVAQDCTVNGVQLLKNDRVLLPCTMTHFMEEYFPDPYLFDINRFSPQRAEHKTRGVYNPYGIGRHICLGAGAAEVQAIICLAHVVNSFDISLSDPGYKLRTRTVPSIHPVGLNIRFSRNSRAAQFRKAG